MKWHSSIILAQWPSSHSVCTETTIQYTLQSPPIMQHQQNMTSCETPISKHRPSYRLLSPPPPPVAGNRRRLHVRGNVGSIPSFLPCSRSQLSAIPSNQQIETRSDPRPINTTCTTRRLKRRSVFNNNTTTRTTRSLKRRSVFHHNTQTERAIDLDLLMGTLPPPPLSLGEPLSPTKSNVSLTVSMKPPFQNTWAGRSAWNESQFTIGNFVNVV